uniref:Leishmanolysin-like peptidase n=1 Tax=Lygus hesperus TaxID=30085 RepID=A0A0A9XKC7_LYGHE
MCTFDRTGLGKCSIKIYSQNLPPEYQYFPDNPRKGGSNGLVDYCPTVIGFSNAVCTDDTNHSALTNMFGDAFGSASRCFYSNLISNSFFILNKTMHCFEATCTQTGQLLLRIQGQNVPCPVNGQSGMADMAHLRGLHGSITCPAASDICDR